MSSLLPVRLPAETDERRAAGILTGAFQSGCQRLDFRVPIQTAIGFVVTHGFYSAILKRPVPMAETFMDLKDAMDFHAARGDGAGVIIAIRENWSVIGEVPTPAQERAIRERAALRERDLQADRMVCRWNGRR